MNYIYGTWSVLCALNVAGVAPAAPEMRKAVAWLIAIQNADGGWGEDGDSYKLDYRGYEQAPSTASQTAWALLGLMAAAARRRGIDRELERRQQPVDRLGVGKADRDFVHHLILTNRARHICHGHIRREELTDEMIPIECPHALAADAPGHGWDVIEMGIVAHRRHRRVEIAGEFRFHVTLEQCDHRLLFAR